MSSTAKPIGEGAGDIAPAQPVPFTLASINIEMTLWIALGLGALALRAWYLDAAPLNNVEAANALNGLALAGGANGTILNPFFSSAQSIIMSVFGASDFSARLPAALAGVVLTMTPLLLRERLGRERTLAFGFLLAISPTLLFASRQAQGAIWGWALGFMAWCCLQRGANRAAFICAGLLLACGQDAVSPLILLIALVAYQYVTAGSSRTRLTIGRAEVLSGVAAFLIASTFAFWRLSGMGEAFNGIASWMNLIPYQAPLGPLRLIAGAIVYDPFILLSAACGVALLILRGRFSNQEASWCIWLVLGAVMLVLNPARDATSVTPVIIGAAALASTALTALLNAPAIDPLGEGLEYPRYAEGIVCGLAVIMMVYAYLGLDMYGAQQQTTWLMTVILGFLMVAGIGVVATLTFNQLVALRGIGLAACLCLLLYTISSGYQLTQTRAEAPAEAYIAEADVSGIRNLVQTVEQISSRAYGDPHTIPLQVLNVAPPALRWALRDQRGITYVARIANTPAALTPIDRKPDDQSSYVGSAFRVTASAALSSVHCSSVNSDGQLDCTPLARWLTQRTVDERSITRWILWLRGDTALKSDGKK
jgi:hypothetical protein